MKIKYVVALIITGVLAFSGLAAGDSVCPPPPPPPPVQMNHFNLTCQFDPRYYRKQVDAIMSFGVAPSAHLHDFFCLGGTNPGIGATSSTLSAVNIQAVSRQKTGGLTDPGWGPFISTAPMYGYWPGNWRPSPKWNGVLTLPGGLTDTWQAPVGTPVIAPPFGALTLAGTSAATTPNPNVAWTCGDGTPSNDHPVDCTGVGRVTAQLAFPDCWDGQGRTVDANGVYSFDHPAGISPSHFTYSVSGACAAGSQHMAQLVSNETFLMPDGAPMVNPYNADGTLGLSFSSGSYLSYHGDYAEFSNHQLSDAVAKCLNNGTPGSCPPGTPIGLHVLA